MKKSSLFALSERLTSYSPTSGYRGFDPCRHDHFLFTVQNGVHPFGHRFLQPGHYVCCLLGVALDDHLVVAHEDRHGLRTLVPTLPQQGACQLQAVGSGSLDRGVEVVGQLLDIHAAPASKRSALCFAA
jgi:hypothetical protein